jgi:hypothetical protein
MFCADAICRLHIGSAGTGDPIACTANQLARIRRQVAEAIGLE